MENNLTEEQSFFQLLWKESLLFKLKFGFVAITSFVGVFVIAKYFRELLFNEGFLSNSPHMYESII